MNYMYRVVLRHNLRQKVGIKKNGLIQKNFDKIHEKSLKTRHFASYIELYGYNLYSLLHLRCKLMLPIRKIAVIK